MVYSMPLVHLLKRLSIVLFKNYLQLNRGDLESKAD